MAMLCWAEALTSEFAADGVMDVPTGAMATAAATAACMGETKHLGLSESTWTGRIRGSRMAIQQLRSGVRGCW